MGFPQFFKLYIHIGNMCFSSCVSMHVCVCDRDCGLLEAENQEHTILGGSDSIVRTKMLQRTSLGFRLELDSG